MRARGKATRDEVLEALPTHGTVLLYLHGDAVLGKPLESGLVLAGGERLTVWELLARPQQIRSAAVLLCACSMSRPADLVPAEMISPATALLCAGAASVIAASWDVDVRATFLLAAHYLYHWRGPDALPPARALRAAQDWMRTSPAEEKHAFFPAMTRSEGSNGLMGAVIKLMRVARPAASTPGPDQPRPEDFARYSHPFYWSGFAALGAVF